MKHTEHVTRIRIFEHADELGTEERTLLHNAAQAALTTHSPYSHYPVGAALLLEDGTIIKGSNQENAAFPLGLCAERTALANYAVNHKGKRVVAIGIKVDSQPAAPCGMCRQALLEVEHEQQHPIQVYMQGDTEQVIEVSSVADLLPLPFFSGNLV